MKHYIGIDLGTTNSAISSFDGERVRVYKSPDQNDVTPSAIYVDSRGNKHMGKRAYDSAARSPDNAATLFKRFMGTSTPVKLAAVNITMTPEECSAEILRLLFGYLPEEVRNSDDAGTVITVPAAFNQMQKDATMAAAGAAGLGKVALMQEPVAAVMSVMRTRKTNGMFLVYDFGGGTLDVAIADSTNGRVSLLSHGGVAMCGGRDFDRLILDSIVKPWLLDKFDLPNDFMTDPKFRTLKHMATWAAEKAKIELSSKEDAVISADDSELRVKDRSGEDIYLDVLLTRDEYDVLVHDLVMQSIESTRETIEKAGLTSHDIVHVVFVGGPTQYKPLRDKVSFELGIAASTDVNPMTAVSEGAALFAESIDWSSQSRGRKSGRGELAAGGGLNVSFAFVSRTPDSKAKLVAKLAGSAVAGAAFQIDSLDSGWSSGRIDLKDGASVEVMLAKPGDNIFKVFVFDGAGGSVKMARDKLTITRTAAQIDAIPASHSIGLEAKKGLSGGVSLDYLVKEGEPLPKRGRLDFKADETLLAGSPGSIKFKLWEGAIEDRVPDNRFIGIFEVKGSDFADGVISKGAEIQVDYEVGDSGRIDLQVTVPSVSGEFRSGKNFYSRQKDIDYTDASKLVIEEAERLSNKVNELAEKVEDSRLDEARTKLDKVIAASRSNSDGEASRKAMDEIQAAKVLIASARIDNLPTTRRLSLDSCVNYFNKAVRKHARPAEETSFDHLAATAGRAITGRGDDFENHLDELRGKNWSILFRQDWFVIDRFKWLAESKHFFPDGLEHARLVAEGMKAMNANDVDALRDVVRRLGWQQQLFGGDEEVLASSNIISVSSR